jgi:hypothetical protein
MKRPLRIFEAQADAVFASFMEQGHTREEALVSTERHFMDLLHSATTEPQNEPVKKLYVASFFRFLKPFMKISS